MVVPICGADRLAPCVWGERWVKQVRSVSTLWTAIGRRVRSGWSASDKPISNGFASTLEPAETSETSQKATVLQWRRVVTLACGLWLTSRIVLIAVTYFASTFPTSGRHVSSGPITTGFSAVTPHMMLQEWLRYDGVWYLNISHMGYWNAQSTVFFPLYPALIAALTFLLGEPHRLLAAVIVSNLAALAAYIGIGLLAAHDDCQEASSNAILVALAYPLAFFLAAPNADALLLAGAALALYFTRRGMWLWAALCAFGATLAHPLGVVLFFPMVWEFGRQHDLRIWPPVSRPHWEGRLSAASVSLRAPRVLLQGILVLGAVPLALGAYATYLGLNFGDPWLFLQAQSTYWNRAWQPLWSSMLALLQGYAAEPAWSASYTGILVDIVPLVLFAVLTLASARRLPVAYTLYMLALLACVVSMPTLGAPDVYRSAGRYLIAAIPMYLLLGRWSRSRPWLDMLISSGGFLLQAVLIIQWLGGFSPL